MIKNRTFFFLKINRSTNPFVSNEIINFMSHKKLQTRFISNFPLDEGTDFNTVDSEKYCYPSVMIDLSLWRSSSVPKISPIIGDQDALNRVGDLSLKLEYSPQFKDKTGMWCIAFIYESKKLMLNLKEGYFFNPLTV